MRDSTNGGVQPEISGIRKRETLSICGSERNDMIRGEVSKKGVVVPQVRSHMVAIEMVLPHGKLCQSAVGRD